MEFPESQNLHSNMFKMNNQWKLIAKSKQKRYVHTNNHMIKAFRDEQTLTGRNDRHKLSDEVVKSRVSLFINKQQCLFTNLSHDFIG